MIYMRPDAEYIKSLLTTFRDATTPTTDVDGLQKAGFDLGDPAFELHMELLIDDGYVESESHRGWGLNKGIDGYKSWSAIPLRLTSSGHEFAEAIENPKAYQTVREKFVGASLSTIKDVVVGVVKAEVGKHIGLNLG